MLYERRKIKGFEGYYSIDSNGNVFSDERVVTTSSGGRLKIKERKLKETSQINKWGNEVKTIIFKFCVEGKKTSVTKKALMKATFPELYKKVENIEGEIWLPIESNEKYEVSNMGRVKKIATYIKNDGFSYLDQEELRHITINNDIRLVVLPENNKLNTSVVSRLVYKAFVGDISRYEHIVFLDGDKGNLKLSNLKAVKTNDYRLRDSGRLV